MSLSDAIVGSSMARRWVAPSQTCESASMPRVIVGYHCCCNRAVALRLRPRDHLVGLLTQVVDGRHRGRGFLDQVVLGEIAELRQHRPGRGKSLLHLLAARLDGIVRRRGDSGVVVEGGVGETALQRQPFNGNEKRVGGGIDLEGVLRGAEVFPLGIGAGGRERHQQHAKQSAKNCEKKTDRIAPLHARHPPLSGRQICLISIKIRLDDSKL